MRPYDSKLKLYHIIDFGNKYILWAEKELWPSASRRKVHWDSIYEFLFRHVRRE